MFYTKQKDKYEKDQGVNELDFVYSSDFLTNPQINNKPLD